MPTRGLQPVFVFLLTRFGSVFQSCSAWKYQKVEKKYLRYGQSELCVLRLYPQMTELPESKLYHCLWRHRLLDRCLIRLRCLRHSCRSLPDRRLLALLRRLLSLKLKSC